MNRKDVEELVLAFGAMAEALAVFRQELVKNGFDKREAAELTKTYLITLTQGGTKNNG